MKVGYISRWRDPNGKETFSYREANATRRIGVRRDSVKVPFLYGTYDYKEVEENTKIMSGGGIVVVTEPFFTTPELKEKLEHWCEWANSCENREYSLFS